MFPFYSCSNYSVHIAIAVVAVAVNTNSEIIALTCRREIIDRAPLKIYKRLTIKDINLGAQHGIIKTYLHPLTYSNNIQIKVLNATQSIIKCHTCYLTQHTKYSSINYSRKLRFLVRYDHASFSLLMWIAQHQDYMSCD